MAGSGMTKRNIGLVLAYLGTRYHGLQMNAGFKTVEGEIFKGLNAAEAISDSNYGDRHKIKWSSCSRTDKGVHAAALVCSTKLLIPTEEDKAIANLGSLPQARIDHWNKFLPEDIRIFKGVRLGKNQRAKTMCSAREYEYLVPATALHGRSVEEFQRILHKFEGTHRFHNFCGRLSTKPRDKVGAKRRRADSEEDEEDEEEDEEDEEGERQEAPAALKASGAAGDAGAEGGGGERRAGGGGAAEPRFGDGLREQTRKASTEEEWRWAVSQDARLTSQKYVRTLFGVVVSPEPISIPVEGDQSAPPLSVFVVRLTAHSFAMHQIRKIMSLSLAVLRGHVPEWVVDVALHSNFLIHMPLAPSEALCLVNVNFWDDRVEEYRMEFGAETEQAMQAFKEAHIYPHIARRVTEVPDDPRRPLPPFEEFWKRYENYRFPDAGGWELLRSEYERYINLKEKVKEEMQRQPPSRPDASWKKDLPQGLMTSICVKYRTLPGPHTAWIRTVMLKALHEGKIQTPEEFKSKQEYVQIFLDYLENNGLSPLDYDIPNRKPPVVAGEAPS